MLKELALKSRSYRGYNEERSVTREELLELIDLTRKCPSATNAQPLKFYPAWEKEEVETILACTRWGGALPELNLPRTGSHPAAFIVILQDETISKATNWVHFDCGIHAQTILLGATEMGLGGLMIGAFSAKKVQETLNLPEHLVPILILAIGEPNETIVLKDVEPGESMKYYRDENDVHYVPKRKLEDLIVKS